MSAATGVRRAPVQHEFDFSLGAAKAKVLKALEEGGLPSGFAHFFQGALFDRMLQGLVCFFAARFQREALARSVERARQQHLDGFSPGLVAARMDELEEEEASQQLALSQPYFQAVLKYSSSRKPQHDKQFFEAMYAGLAAVLGEAFERVGRQQAIEQELGRLFRGRHFNMAVRLHRPKRPVETLTVAQLWAVKHESDNRSLHAKLISGLYDKLPALSVQVASLSNSPLVCQAVASPTVSRSLLADPAERDALLSLPYCRQRKQAISGSEGGPSGAAGGPVSRRQTCAASRRQTRCQAQDSPAAAGGGQLATPVGGARASALRPFQGTVESLPEAAGLPYDEAYAYLCLLRRSVVYGPTLGIPTAPPAGASRRGSMTAMALAPPSELSTSSSWAEMA